MFTKKIMFGVLPITILLSACNTEISNDFSKKPFDFLKNINSSKETSDNEEDASPDENDKSLGDILSGVEPSINTNGGFAKSIAQAVLADPSIIAAKSELAAQISQVEVSKSSKDFQVSATALGGVEDVTDEVAGVAVVLNATRVINDGGKIDARIASEEFAASAAQHRLQAKMDEKALSLVNAWVDLDRYEKLNDMIGSRLLILNPLIEQLETVAAAGMGDASQVAAAQRTVSLIRVTQSDVTERLEQSRVAFRNSFGLLPSNTKLDTDFLAKRVPTKVTKKMAQSAPSILAGYASYQVAEANLRGVEAKSKFDLGFETKVTRPFADSGYDSDESVGLVFRKDLYNGKKLEEEEKAARARVDSAIAQIQATYLQGERAIETAQQTIKSMDKAIALSRETAELTRDEISYLRKQLIIGGSTLDSVLSAEARLYDAESKEINFAADKLKAQATILSALGMLSKSLGLAAN